MSDVLAPVRSSLRQAVISSGLVTRQQLTMVLAGMVHSPERAGRSLADVSDEELGNRLVELNLLNRWQLDQLLLGRTKFTLGPYRILDAIGKGGMGHVFKARHELLGRIEAVKVLPASRATPEAVDAFRREMRVQAQLEHPSLVRVSYAGQDGEIFYLVTEYVPGVDLRRLVRRHGPVPYEAAAAIISQAAEALEYAHRRGLVHRDVKPGNLLVMNQGRTKLIDLGLAWFLFDGVTQGGAELPKRVAGTADYIAPETILAPQRVLPVSDIYSLGCALYYAVTGKVPYPGGKTADKVRRHLSDRPIHPRHFCGDLPSEFCDAVAAMMQRDHNQRVPTARAVVDLMRPWHGDEALRIAGQISRSVQAGSPSASDFSKSGGLEETIGELPEEAVAEFLQGGSENTQSAERTGPIYNSTEDTETSGILNPVEATGSGFLTREQKARLALAAGLLAATGLFAVLLGSLF